MFCYFEHYTYEKCLILRDSQKEFYKHLLFNIRTYTRTCVWEKSLVFRNNFFECIFLLRNDDIFEASHKIMHYFLTKKTNVKKRKKSYP